MEVMPYLLRLPNPFGTVSGIQLENLTMPFGFPNSVMYFTGILSSLTAASIELFPCKPDNRRDIWVSRENGSGSVWDAKKAINESRARQVWFCKFGEALFGEGVGGFSIRGSDSRQ